MTTTKRILDIAPCKRTCRAGRPCCCVGRAHTQHICRNPDCQCHQPEAFGLRLDGWRYVDESAQAVQALEVTR
jgi:hypothetical protein